ncbi:heat shock protein beta-3 [Esox lucius]|uniref:SHSP domain-containing protein n=1 Tax=Esox lucius TaxID=8010 RepID=A0AAY5KC14_ESOLU|nr:heat shock protein beta-3 [Esox lucius]
MDTVCITHWVNIPVRHQALFQGRDLDACAEDHDLFALPGPAIADPGVELGLRTEPVYQVLLDVTQFRPEEILIQVFEGWLLIRAQHGARMDEHGSVSRSFIRQYPLPEKLQLAGDLRALLCHDGILVVESKNRRPVGTPSDAEEEPC